MNDDAYKSIPTPPTRRHFLLASAAALPLAAGCATRSGALLPELAREQVRAAELAFAATMAARDVAAFGALIADDAVFINGGKPLRGKSAIIDYWGQYYKSPTAPFSWAPTIVEVGAQASLGYTEGPVTAGTAVIARFYSTWQRQPDGRWLVIFDNGYAECKR